MSDETMSKKSEEELEDDLRPEYDFSQMQIVARGPGRQVPAQNVVRLAPDVAEVFPDDEAVNEALRLLIKLARAQVTQAR